jgi:hypothetical protein
LNDRLFALLEIFLGSFTWSFLPMRTEVVESKD